MYYTLLSVIQTTEKLPVSLFPVTVIGRHRIVVLIPVSGLAFDDLLLDDEPFIRVQDIQRVLDPGDDAAVVLQVVGLADALLHLDFPEDPLAVAVVLG